MLIDRLVQENRRFYTRSYEGKNTKLYTLLYLNEGGKHQTKKQVMQADLFGTKKNRPDIKSGELPIPTFTYHLPLRGIILPEGGE